MSPGASDSSAGKRRWTHIRGLASAATSPPTAGGRRLVCGTLGEPALRVCWTSAGAWLLVWCGEQPPAPSPTLGQRLECLEHGLWSSALGPPRQTSARVQPWVPSAVSQLSHCGRLSSLRSQHLPTLEGSRDARRTEQGPWTTSPAAFAPGARRGAAGPRTQAHAASLQSPAPRTLVAASP